MRIDIAFKLPATIHPTEQELHSFMSGALPARKAAPIVRHLLKRCERCLRVTRRLWSFGETVAQPRGGRP